MFVVFCFCWCVLWVKPTLDSGITIRYDLSAGVFYPEIHHLGVSGKGAYPPNLVLFRLGNLKMINHDKPSTDFVTLFFFRQTSCQLFGVWTLTVTHMMNLGSLGITNPLDPHHKGVRTRFFTTKNGVFHPSVYVQTTACVYSIYIDTVYDQSNI